MDSRVIVQARMISSRFPGKVLALLDGKPVLDHLVDRLKAVLGAGAVVVATSDDRSDDPLAAHVPSLGVTLFRGPLENVAERFRLCVERHPCEWFFRVSGDSPLLDATLLPLLRARAEPGVDLITNVFPRTYPKGHSVELLRTETFVRLRTGDLTPEEKEHVTKVYYNHPDRFRIVNVASGDPSLSRINYCVDTPEDLARLEAHVAAKKR